MQFAGLMQEWEPQNFHIETTKNKRGKQRETEGKTERVNIERSGHEIKSSSTAITYKSPAPAIIITKK